MEKITHQSPLPNFAWRIPFRKYAPFGLHLALTALVATVFLAILDGRTFNTNFRRSQYQEVDGSASHVTSYAPLQSDITTAASVAATVTRVAGGWWAGGYLWRCIFISMERGGISLEGLSQVILKRPPAPRHFARKSSMVFIYITLFATFAIDYFSAALTGSLIWEATDRLIPGSVPLTAIQRGISGADLTSYFTNSFDQTRIVALGSASANLAWVALQPNPTLATITEPSTTIRRIISGTQYLPTNSTLANVTIPYFTVDAFEWIQDPDSILTAKQIPLFLDYSQYSPYFSDRGIGGLLPDSQWGPTNTPRLGDPQIVSETRLFTFRVSRTYASGNGSCPQNYMVDPGSQINLHEYLVTDDYYDCFAIANVTYRAGAAMCQNCKLISPTVVEAQAPLSLIPDSFTSLALALAPSLGTNLIFTNYSIPQNYGTRKNLAIELTSQAYEAAWAAFSDNYGNQLDSTAVEIALPTLRANVIQWRVYLWVALHLWVWVLGLIFVGVQSQCNHPWVEDPMMAVFWLDTSAVLTGTGVDPWQPGEELPNDGMLKLDRAGQPSHSVTIM